jgi:hypothetical protein
MPTVAATTRKNETRDPTLALPITLALLHPKGGVGRSTTA